MDRWNRAARHHPLLLAVGAVVGLLASMAVAVAVVVAVSDLAVAAPEAQVAGQLAGTLLVLVVLQRLGWLEVAGVTRLGTRNVWLVTGLVLACSGAAALLAFFGTLDVDLSVDGGSVPVLAHTGLAGVMEELLFRGLVLHILVVGWAVRQRGDAAAVVISALLFGMLHFVNAGSGSLDVTALQALEAFLSAVLYGVLVLVGGSVWPAVALHGLGNLVVNAAAENTAGFDVTVGEYTNFVLLELPVLVVAVGLLARRRPRHADPAGHGLAA